VPTDPRKAKLSSDEVDRLNRLRHWFRPHPDIQATLSTNPDHFSPITSKSRLASFRYALAGWLYVLRYQKNVRIQAIASIAVFALGLWLGLQPLDWALLIIVITLNWMAEFLNAAIEAVVNVASPNLHPMARVSKDVAAATSLLTAVASVIVGALVMGPPLLERVGPGLVRILMSH
jgi:diacylglycerol kinase